MNTIKNCKISGNKNTITQISGCNCTIQNGNDTFINGKKLEMPKSLFFNNCICQVNGKTYLNGKEYRNGKWRYTVRSLWNSLF